MEKPNPTGIVVMPVPLMVPIDAPYVLKRASSEESRINVAPAPASISYGVDGRELRGSLSPSGTETMQVLAAADIPARHREAKRAASGMPPPVRQELIFFIPITFSF